MSNQHPSCRLQVLFASASRKAAVFRRGPKKTWCLIAWDRTRDTFEAGQWLRRATVYPEKSGLSPDGEHLVTFVGTFKPPFGTFTVLCRPPCFTALTLWPNGTTHGGGGRFLGNREIVLGQGDTPAPGFALPTGFRASRSNAASETKAAELSRSLPFRWRQLESEAVMDCDDGLALLARPRGKGSSLSIHDYALRTRHGELAIARADWAGFDTNGDLVLAIGGALLRLDAAALRRVRTGEDILSRARLLADFSDMRFEPVVAPYASVVERGRRERLKAAYEPVLDRTTKEDRRGRIADRKAMRSASPGARDQKPVDEASPKRAADAASDVLGAA